MIDDWYADAARTSGAGRPGMQIDAVGQSHGASGTSELPDIPGPSAADRTASQSPPTDAVTAAAMAPSTSGASARTATTPSAMPSVSTARTLSTALPMSARITTPAPASASRTASATRPPSVPSVPPGPPPAAMMRTSPPATSAAMAASPSAIAAECDTNTMPGTGSRPWRGFYNVERGSTTTTNEVSVAIQSIERGAAILRALAGGSRRLGVSELSDRLGLAKGTVHGLLRALQDEGFVEQDADSGKYQLGGSLLQLGNIYLDVNELRGRALAWSDNLAMRSGEAVRVGTPHGNGVLVIHHVFRPDNTLQILEVGAAPAAARDGAGQGRTRSRPATRTRPSLGRPAQADPGHRHRAGRSRPRVGGDPPERLGVGA